MYELTKFINDYRSLNKAWQYYNIETKFSSHWDEETNTLYVPIAGANQENTKIDISDNVLTITVDHELMGKTTKTWTVKKVTDIDVSFEDGIITLVFTFKTQNDVNINYL